MFSNKEGIYDVMNEKWKLNYKKSLLFNDTEYSYYSLEALSNHFNVDISHLPFTIKVYLEAAIRNMDEKKIKKEHVERLVKWNTEDRISEVPFKPHRVLLHDTTGIPALVDLALLRDVMCEQGEDANKVNPIIPVDLVIDHSLIVDFAESENAMELNEHRDFERNKERYRFLKWAQLNFDNFQVIPPSSGIMHQINLEYLSKVIIEKKEGNDTILYPDSLVGADSHTTMINGLGIAGYGVGGIEAEVAMLGDSLYFISPEVIGVKMSGKLKEGVTATDLALTITSILREKNVVGKIVEFFGKGIQNLTVFDRSAISNMAPESGATMSYFPIDNNTLKYLSTIGYTKEKIELIEKYFKQQKMFYIPNNNEPIYSDVIELDLSSVTTTLAGPKRPQDNIFLKNLKTDFKDNLTKPISSGGYGLSKDELNEKVPIHNNNEFLENGSIAIAAITSCTNTSNPDLMIGAGLVAKKAFQKGLLKPSYVKSSLTPGSKVVTDYLEKSNLLYYLEKMGFFIAGYGCATCIGNSGDIYKTVDNALEKQNLTIASILSGNRNFEGRIHPKIKANYLASPPLVVAYALAGTVNIDLRTEPIGYNDNAPVFLEDIWPSSKEIEKIKNESLNTEMFVNKYSNITSGSDLWNQLDVSKEELYDWDKKSNYISKPPFLSSDVISSTNFNGSRILLMLGNSITTDHISPAGVIPLSSVAGQYLKNRGVSPREFNSYPSRRGNYKVMKRGAFANVRLHNEITPNIEGGYTKFLPKNEVLPVYEASVKYKENNIPLTIVAGKEYGTGSSRDWAAKATLLLGVKTVIAESFERIHRNNLVGMGVLPLQFCNGFDRVSLNLSGSESLFFDDQLTHLYPRKSIKVKVVRDSGEVFYFNAIIRLDNEVEVDYYKNGGILPSILQELKTE